MADARYIVDLILRARDDTAAAFNSALGNQQKFNEELARGEKQAGKNSEAFKKSAARISQSQAELARQLREVNAENEQVLRAQVKLEKAARARARVEADSSSSTAARALALQDVKNAEEAYARAVAATIEQKRIDDKEDEKRAQAIQKAKEARQEASGDEIRATAELNKLIEEKQRAGRKALRDDIEAAQTRQRLLTEEIESLEKAAKARQEFKKDPDNADVREGRRRAVLITGPTFRQEQGKQELEAVDRISTATARYASARNDQEAAGFLKTIDEEIEALRRLGQSEEHLAEIRQTAQDERKRYQQERLASEAFNKDHEEAKDLDKEFNRARAFQQELANDENKRRDQDKAAAEAEAKRKEAEAKKEFNFQHSLALDLDKFYTDQARKKEKLAKDEFNFQHTLALDLDKFYTQQAVDKAKREKDEFNRQHAEALDLDRFYEQNARDLEKAEAARHAANKKRGEEEGKEKERRARDIAKAQAQLDAAARNLAKPDLGSDDYEFFRRKLSEARQELVRLGVDGQESQRRVKKALDDAGASVGKQREEQAKKTDADKREAQSRREITTAFNEYTRAVDAAARAENKSRDARKDSRVGPTATANAARDAEARRVAAERAKQRLDAVIGDTTEVINFDADTGQAITKIVILEAVKKDAGRDVTFEVKADIDKMAGLGSVLGSIGSQSEHANGGLRNAVNGISTLDNVFRGFLTLGIVLFFNQIIIAAIALAGALAALASSAIYAGGALGGGLLAGAAQAIPVLGVLGAAFQRFTKILEAVKQQQLVDEQQEGQADKIAKRVADAQDRIATANDGLTSAQERQRDAQEALSEARRGSLATLQDLIVKEREAELAARGAALSQREAQEALQKGIREGNTSDIERLQLSVAQAKAAVTRAGLSASEASRNADDARAGKDPKVEAAEDAAKAADRAVKAAERSRNAAIRAARETGEESIAAAGKLDALLGKLSASEKRLFDQVNKLFNFFDGDKISNITDPIIDQFSNILDKAFGAFDNPALIGRVLALSNEIATQIGNIFDRLFAGNNAEQFLGFISDATENLAPFASIISNVIDVFIDLADIGSEIFSLMLGDLDSLTGKFADFTASAEGQNTIREFFKEGYEQLKLFVDLLGQVGLLILAIAAPDIGGGAEAGGNILKGLTDGIRDLNEAARSPEGREAIQEFFDNTIKALGILMSLVESVAKGLAGMFSDQGIAQFSAGIDIINNVLVPALFLILQALGAITYLLDLLFDIPIFGDWIAKATAVALAFGAIAFVLTSIYDLAKALAASRFIALFATQFTQLQVAAALAFVRIRAAFAAMLASFAGSRVFLAGVLIGTRLWAGFASTALGARLIAFFTPLLASIAARFGIAGAASGAAFGAAFLVGAALLAAGIGFLIGKAIRNPVIDAINFLIDRYNDTVARIPGVPEIGRLTKDGEIEGKEKDSKGNLSATEADVYVRGTTDNAGDFMAATNRIRERAGDKPVNWSLLEAETRRREYQRGIDKNALREQRRRSQQSEKSESGQGSAPSLDSILNDPALRGLLSGIQSQAKGKDQGLLKGADGKIKIPKAPKIPGFKEPSIPGLSGGQGAIDGITGATQEAAERLSPFARALRELTRDGGALDLIKEAIENATTQALAKTKSMRFRIGSTGLVFSGGRRGTLTEDEALAENLDTLKLQYKNYRDSLNEINKQLANAKNRLKNATGTDDRQAIIAGISNLEKRRDELNVTIGDKLEELFEKQIEAFKKRTEKLLDKVKVGGFNLDRIQQAIEIADAKGAGDIADGLGGAQLEILQRQRVILARRLKEAKGRGMEAMVKEIQGELDKLDVTIAKSITDRFKQAVEEADERADIRERRTKRIEKLADITRRIGNGITGAVQGAQTDAAALASRGNDLQAERADLLGLLARASREGNTDAVKDLVKKLEDNADAILENTVAQIESAAKIQKAIIDQIEALKDFRLNTLGGLKGLLSAIEGNTGPLDPALLESVLAKIQASLQTALFGFQDQLKSQFGIDVTGKTGLELFNALNAMSGPGGALEALRGTLSGPMLAIFDDLISKILDNGSKLEENTKELGAAKNAILQTFTSSAFRLYRQALFNGTGGLQATYEIPSFNGVGQAMRPANAQVTVQNAAVPRFGEQAAPTGDVTNIEINQAGENVDPVALAARLNFERKTAPSRR